jgi:hypothetical protein
MTITDAVVNQTITVSGCAAAKSGGLGNATFFSDNTYTWATKDANGDPILSSSGSYAVTSTKSGFTIYMEPDDASRATSFARVEALALANCKIKKPTTSTVDIIDPSVLTSKNSATVNSKGQPVILQLNMAGKQVNDSKVTGSNKLGTFKLQVKMQGFVVGAPPTT